jgi:hypothetical protein
MNNILYYPYINLPENDWTLRTLLYYDNIGSIVPDEYYYNRNKYDLFMWELVDKELVTPINPMNVINNPWESTKPFISLIENNKELLQKSRNHFNMTGRNIRNPNKLQTVKLHINKFDSEIFYNLKEFGLAKKGYANWYFVEKRTADELMKFLANIISVKTDRMPVTDIIRKRYIQPFYKKNEIKKREKILENLIPFPKNISLDKVLKFKEKNIDSLKAFKNKIELIVLDQNIEIDSALFKEKVYELELRKEELSRKMNENNFGDILFGTVCGLGAAVSGLETGSTFGAFLGSLPGFANAIHSALKIEKPEGIFDQSGMKYLALAEKRGVIKR